MPALIYYILLVVSCCAEDFEAFLTNI